MWFDEIMDDFKNAIRVANYNKGIFIPVFIKLGLNLLLFVYIFAIILSFIFRFSRIHYSAYSGMDFILEQLPGMAIYVIITYAIILVVYSIMQAGTNNLYKAAINGIKPKAAVFSGGVKQYFLKELGGNLFIHLIVLVLSPVLLLLYSIYIILAGTLTAGWGITFLSAATLVFFMVWPAIVVSDNETPIRAIGKSIKLGRKYFCGLFIIMLSYIMINQYLVSILGPFAALIAGWFIAGIISTYYELLVFLLYSRKKNQL